MKLSDKALRLIGRELILNKSAPSREKEPHGLRLRSLRRAPKATVLSFKKRLR